MLCTDSESAQEVRIDVKLGQRMHYFSDTETLRLHLHIMMTPIVRVAQQRGLCKELSADCQQAMPGISESCMLERSKNTVLKYDCIAALASQAESVLTFRKA